MRPRWVVGTFGRLEFLAATVVEDLTDGVLLRRVRLAAAISIPLAILGGVLLTVIGMMRSFESLATEEGVERSQLAGDIALSLSIGVIAVPIAIVASENLALDNSQTSQDQTF